MSLTNYKDRFLFVSGGQANPRTASGLKLCILIESVYKYDVSNDSWLIAPYMNHKRKLHSSCAVGNNIYAFFGFTEDDNSD